MRHLAAPPKPSRSLIFESLEPRLLLSADFNPVAPMGSLIHQSSQSGNLAAADSSVSYTLSLDAAQKISVVFETSELDLQGSIELYDLDGTTLLGSASTADSGGMALLDSVVGANAGNYRLDVRNLAGDGAFNANIFLNATVESETVTGVNNNTIASAQALESAGIVLGGTGQLRYAAIGQLSGDAGGGSRLGGYRIVEPSMLKFFKFLQLSPDDDKYTVDILDST